MKAMLAEQRTVIDNPLSLKRADEGELNTSDENAVETTAAPKAHGARWLLIVAAILLGGGGWFLYNQVFAAGKAASAKSAAEGGGQQGKATLGFQAKDGAGGTDAKGLPATRIETVSAPRSFHATRLSV